MNIALTVHNGVVSPLFPGVELHLVSGDGEYAATEFIDTLKWPQTDWGKQLLRRNVGVLICSGLEQFQWGMFQGYGLEVFPNFIGRPEEALGQWRAGKLTVPDFWPLLGRENRDSD